MIQPCALMFSSCMYRRTESFTEATSHKPASSYAMFYTDRPQEVVMSSRVEMRAKLSPNRQRTISTRHRVLDLLIPAIVIWDWLIRKAKFNKPTLLHLLLALLRDRRV